VNIIHHSLEENNVSYAWMVWVYQPFVANDPTLLVNNKRPSSSIIQRITNHCLLCDLLENHLDVLLWVAPCSGCTNVLSNPLSNRYNLRNLVDHGIGSNICNLFMLHTTSSYKLVAFSWLCAHWSKMLECMNWSEHMVKWVPTPFPFLNFYSMQNVKILHLPINVVCHPLYMLFCPLCFKLLVVSFK
jgi:hypothetical protein